MAKFFFSMASLASVLLLGSVTAATTECSAETKEEVLGVISNTTNLNSCAPGSTWKLTSLFDTATLSETDFAKFCNATECMHPMHELLEDLESCVGDFNGASIDFFDKINEVHDKCHEALEGGEHHDDGDDHGDHDHGGSGSHDHSDHDDHSDVGSDDGSSTAGSATVPAPSPSAAVSVRAISTVVVVAVTSSSLLL